MGLFRSIPWLKKGVFRMVSRKNMKIALVQGAKSKNTTDCLLSPFVTPYELRTILKVDYSSVFKLLGVRYLQRKYYWNDECDRTFYSINKKHIFLSFPMIAKYCGEMNLNPIMVDPEPYWDDIKTSINRIPVVGILGNTQHGKTSLIDALANTNYKATEYGSTTQSTRAHTASFITLKQTSNSLSPSSPSSSPMDKDTITSITSRLKERGITRFQPDLSNVKQHETTSSLTFIDTPGQEIFEIVRGRISSSCDVVVVIVSLHEGIDESIEKLILQASSFKKKIMFVLSKSDSEFANPKLLRLQLENLTTRMREAGDIDVDLTLEAQQSIAVSSKTGHNLDALIRELLKLDLSQVSSIIPHQCRTPYLNKQYAHVKRRVEALQSMEDAVSGVGVVLDVEMRHDDKGRTIHVLMKQGSVIEGQYFIAGTHWGRVRRLWTSESSYAAQSIAAGPGMAVQIHGLDYEGEVSPDDTFLVVPKLLAWRVSNYRRDMERLCSSQVSGVSMDHVTFEMDSLSLNSRVQGSDAYDVNERPLIGQRITQIRIAEFVSDQANTKQEPMFKNTTTEELERPLHDLSLKDKKYKDTWGYSSRPPDMGEDTDEDEKQLTDIPDDERRYSGSERTNVFVASTNEEYDFYSGEKLSKSEVAADREANFIEKGTKTEKEISSEETGRGRKTKKSRTKRLEQFLSSEADDLEEETFEQFKAKYKSQISTDVEHQNENRSFILQGYDESNENGQWSSRNEVDEESKERWVGYADKYENDGNTLLKLKNTRKYYSWEEKVRQKEEQSAANRNAEAALILEAEKIRREAVHQAPLTQQEEEEFLQLVLHENDKKNKLLPQLTRYEDDGKEFVPLPSKGTPIVPIILKTSLQQSFDVILDELELLQKELQVRTPVVYGGIGAVRPTDVTHAEVEQHYSHCPIYAFQVSTLPQASKAAETSNVQIRTFHLYSELVEDVRLRCLYVKKIVEKNQYRESLRQAPTKSGKFALLPWTLQRCITARHFGWESSIARKHCS